MTVQGWCPNHKSGGTERIAVSGMTIRSAQPTEDDSLSGNQNPEAFLLPGRRAASSLVREPNARLTIVAPLCALSDHFAAVKRFLSTGWETVTCREQVDRHDTGLCREGYIKSLPHRPGRERGDLRDGRRWHRPGPPHRQREPGARE